MTSKAESKNAETNSISQGDVVRLKSGDTLYTVREMRGDDVVCEWDLKGVIKEHTFKKWELELAKHGHRAGYVIDLSGRKPDVER